MDGVTGEVIVVPAILHAEQIGDELNAELGSAALLVLEGVVLHDIDADDGGVLADVFGDSGDLAVGEAARIWHAGARSVDPVDDVQVQADPNVIGLSGELIDHGEKRGEVADEKIEKREGRQLLAADEVELGLIEVVAADMEEAGWIDFALRGMDLSKPIRSEAHE